MKKLRPTAGKYLAQDPAASNEQSGWNRPFINEIPLESRYGAAYQQVTIVSSFPLVAEVPGTEGWTHLGDVSHKSHPGTGLCLQVNSRTASLATLVTLTVVVTLLFQP